MLVPEDRQPCRFVPLQSRPRQPFRSNSNRATRQKKTAVNPSTASSKSYLLTKITPNLSILIFLLNVFSVFFNFNISICFNKLFVFILFRNKNVLGCCLVILVRQINCCCYVTDHTRNDTTNFFKL